MNPGTPQGTFNHWRHEADFLPVPQIEGEWCISPGGVRFRVGLGCDQDERPLLAWEVRNSAWAGTGIFFRPTLIP